MEAFGNLFNMGFWGMGLALFFWPLSLIGNLVCSLVIFIHGETKNSPRKVLTIGFLAALVICPAAIILFFRHEPLDAAHIIANMVWLWYFILVPQLLMRLIINGLINSKFFGHRLKLGALRLVLTLLIPTCLCVLHIVVGSEVFDITPD